MRYFQNVKNIEEAKGLFRKLSKELHPDLGGIAEAFVAMRKEFEQFIECFVAERVANDKYAHDVNSFTFSNIIKKIIDWNLKIEVIGYWVYAKDSFSYKDQLKDLGFWFSSKHKAWIFSGGNRIAKRVTKMSMDTIKRVHGAVTLRDEQDYQSIEA
jgi:hypothetical protein